MTGLHGHQSERVRTRRLTQLRAANDWWEIGKFNCGEIMWLFHDFWH